MTNYEKVAKALTYIHENFKTRPTLEEIANDAFLSKYHFQRLFKEWVGISPKKYLQFLTLEFAKERISEVGNLNELSEEMGLSSSGRLHDLFINIQSITPGDYKRQGDQLKIRYSFGESPFGNYIVASTLQGICFLSFCLDEKEGVKHLKMEFPKSELEMEENPDHFEVERFLNGDLVNGKIQLHLKGTAFQLTIWKALLSIPEGNICSYKQMAEFIQKPKASRAVGTAIGSNPVAFLIPCHRVIQSLGGIGGYRWDEQRKRAILCWEGIRQSEK